MSHEAYLFSLVGGLFLLLQVVGMAWINSVGKTVTRIEDRMRAYEVAQAETKNELFHAKHDTESVLKIHEGRLAHFYEVTSEMKDKLGRVTAQVAMCPNCAQPHRTGEQREEEAGG